MSNSDIGELPQPDARDRLHKLVTTLISGLPVPYASEIIELIIKPPLEKRRNEWFQSVVDLLLILQQKVENFKIEDLSQNEGFISTFTELTQIAVRTHEQEKLECLRNATLNSALPNAPDEIRQKMFSQWLQEFTPWHIKVLRVFTSASVSDVSLDLDDKDWMINIELDRLSRIIEAKYAEMSKQDGVYIQIIKELHLKGLIANKLPEMGLVAEISGHPKLTPLAKEFLDFIKSPLD